MSLIKIILFNTIELDKKLSKKSSSIDIELENNLVLLPPKETGTENVRSHPR